ncbi:helix-turn-helix domain-containing protein [Cupriavidus sp. 30B13]|uniref:helix-turn-helix domain-containing protein n=1 Tax=Cupriavidus sp. 30B13 TaxID=3384241 RepID=UPI003B9091B1
MLLFAPMDKLNTPKKPVLGSNKDWHRVDIKAALERAGYSLRQLSLQHGYAPGSLKATLDRPWPCAERIIAGAIGVHPAEIWPSRYDASGNPMSGRNQRGIGRWSTRKSISALNHRNVESAVAA